MKKGDIVRLVTGTSAIEITKVRLHTGEARGIYVSSGYETPWRPLQDFTYLEEEKDTMTQINNNSALIATLQAQRGMTTVKVRLKNESNTIYTYKVMPGVALEKDDYVVVQAGQTVAVGRVTSVDEFPDIDLDSNFQYKWVIQKVDLTQVLALAEEEKSISKQFAMAEAQEKLAALARVSGISLDQISTPMLEASK